MGDIRDRLRGRVIPAVPVPFDSDGSIDVTAQNAYIHWMTQQPAGAIAIWAHTGRGLHLSQEQRAGVLEAWRSGMADLPIVCGVGAPAGPLPTSPGAKAEAVLQLTVAMVREAQAGGASAVLVHPPGCLRDLPDAGPRAVELHVAVAEVGLPVIAFYLYEDAGGVAYDSDTIARILGTDGVVGIKLATLDSVMTFQDLAVVVKAEPSTLLITGEDRFLGYSLALGADAALVGIAAACTDACAALLDSWFQGESGAFVDRMARMDRFARATFCTPMDGYVQRMLWALEADGVLEAEARDPFGPELTATDRELVREAVIALRSP